MTHRIVLPLTCLLFAWAVLAVAPVWAGEAAGAAPAATAVSAAPFGPGGPPVAKAEDPQEALGKQVSPWSVIPFALILLSMAIIPLIYGPWWDQNLNKAIISFLCALPILAYLLWIGPLGQEVLVDVLHDYYGFIVLLLALFTASGGIFLEGDLKATPLINTLFLAAGGVLASFIGTTGASVLLVRPLINTNRHRQKKIHTFIFLIFIVSNIGGSLLPVGDPPLFLGYLYGVPFSWTFFAMWPMWLTAVGILLVIYYVWDSWAYSHETDRHRRTERSRPRLHGKLNFLLIAGVLLSVILLRRYEFPSGAKLDLAWMQQPMLILMAFLSFATDYRSRERARKTGAHQHQTPRDRNLFTFAPMVEVAVLFLGIFITMTPAICLLKAYGPETGITAPWQFYWMSGGLSSFLDNAPTYATYFALGQGVTKGLLASNPNLPVVLTNTGPIGVKILLAISLGSVFMGANSYIGNAPNLMVRAICEEAKVKMPSFFGYMMYSIGILIPTFLIVMFIYLM
jgi:Na+/H+ antiporter NhaD/arsenite permease-like protein